MTRDAKLQIGPAIGQGRRGLVLFGRGEPGDPLGYVLLDLKSGDVIARGIADGRDAAPAAAPARTMLVLSAAEVQVRRLAVPARTSAQARAAARYQFEGLLIADADAQFAVSGALDTDGHRLAAVIAAPRLAQWLEACRRIGAAPAAVWIDATLWPAPDDAAVIVKVESRVLVAAGPYGGYAIEGGLAGAVFGRWASQNGFRARRILVDPAARAEWDGAEPALSQPGEPVDAAAVLARAAFTPPPYGVNLGARETAAARPRWRLWSAAAALAVLAVLAQSGVQVATGLRDQEAAASLISVAQTELRAVRPSAAPPPADFPAHVRALVKAEAQARQHPVLMIQKPLHDAMAAHPQLQLEAVQHDGSGRSVTVRVSGLAAPEFETLAGWMRARGMTVALRDVQPEAGRLVATLSVESPG